MSKLRKKISITNILNYRVVYFRLLDIVRHRDKLEDLFIKTSIIVKEKYYNDETSIKDTWYWTVRNKLENICMNKVYFYKSESN